MISVNVPEGRLVTVVVASPISVEDVKGLGAELKTKIRSLNEPVIIAGDLRGLGVVAPDVGQAFLALMRSDNPHIEAAAHLVGDSVIEGMQVERLINQADSEKRRGCRTRDDVMAFLDPYLEAAEAEALCRFYARKRAL